MYSHEGDTVADKIQAEIDTMLKGKHALSWRFRILLCLMVVVSIGAVTGNKEMIFCCIAIILLLGYWMFGVVREMFEIDNQIIDHRTELAKWSVEQVSEKYYAKDS